MSGKRRIRRREFLAKASKLLAIPYVATGISFAGEGKTKPSERMVIGMIGVGGMGTVHLRNMLQFQKTGDVQVVAVCDVDEKRLGQAAIGPGVCAARGFRGDRRHRSRGRIFRASPAATDRTAKPES